MYEHCNYVFFFTYIRNIYILFMNIHILLKYLYIKYVIITNKNSIFEKNMMVLNLNTISLPK